MSDLIKAAILGLVEGVTEFLPISSTGHLIIVNDFVGFGGDFAATFNVLIQLGAILAVVAYFWRRLIPFGAGKASAEKNAVRDLWIKAAIGVMPVFLIGAFAANYIKEKLFNHMVVSIALIVGGVVLVAVERRRGAEARIRSIADLGYRTAFFIGLIQCAAMVPGVSRSAATIIGAMLLGASRVVAAEFSFFLAIPTMFAASAYMLYKHGFVLSGGEASALAVGFVVSFVVALAVIAGFMRFISTRDFRPFGYYRVALGAAVIAYYYFTA